MAGGQNTLSAPSPLLFFQHIRPARMKLYVFWGLQNGTDVLPSILTSMSSIGLYQWQIVQMRPIAELSAILPLVFMCILHVTVSMCAQPTIQTDTGYVRQLSSARFCRFPHQQYESCLPESAPVSDFILQDVRDSFDSWELFNGITQTGQFIELLSVGFMIKVLVSMIQNKLTRKQLQM